MFLLIDNYDSFVYNLASYVEELGEKIEVLRVDELDFHQLDQRISDLDGLIISPGPKRPEDAVESLKVLDRYQDKLPILGVCLGHQVMGHYYGGQVKKGKTPVHGKVSLVSHTQHEMFEKVPESFKVTRYHSLSLVEESMPDCLEVTAKSEDGVIMGIAHKSKWVYGVQYHPEALLTEYGHQVLQNFINQCKKGAR